MLKRMSSSEHIVHVSDCMKGEEGDLQKNVISPGCGAAPFLMTFDGLDRD
jgi:hypothetical protein